MANEITAAFANAFRDYVTNGVPASGKYEPQKSVVRAVGATVQAQLDAVQAAQNGGYIGFTTRAAMNASLAYVANTVAHVFADSTPAYNGVYLKSGGSGSGSWTKVTDLDEVALQAALDAALAALAAANATAIADVEDVLTQREEYLLPAASGFRGQVEVDDDFRVISGVDLDGRRWDAGDVEGTHDFLSYVSSNILYVEAPPASAIPVSSGIYASVPAHRIEGPTLDYIGVTSGAARERRTVNLAPKVALDPDYTRVLGSISMGQSLSIGVAAGARYTTHPFDDGRAVMFSGGVYPLGTDGETLDVLKDSRLADIVKLRESLPVTDGPWGETHVSWFVHWMLTGGLASTDAMLASAHGHGNRSYAALKKGTQPYANALRGVQRGMIAAKLSGRTYIVDHLLWIQGHNDSGATTAEYAAYLVQLQANFETDCKAITGQTEDIPLVTCQTSCWFAGAALAPYVAAVANPKIVCMGPMYQYEYSGDDIHMTGKGYEHLGIDLARALLRYKSSGKKTGLEILSAVRTGSTVAVTFNNAGTTLAIDTTIVTGLGADRGISWVDAGDGNAITVSSVAVGAANRLDVTLSGTPTGTAQKLRFGDNGTAAHTGPAIGPRTNIRNTNPTTVDLGNGLGTVTLHDWCPLAEVSVT